MPTPSFREEKKTVNIKINSPKAPPSSQRKKSFGMFALAEHSLSFLGWRMFVGSFDGVRPCGGRDSAARRKDERRDNLHPQEQEAFNKEVLHGVLRKPSSEATAKRQVSTITRRRRREQEGDEDS